MVSILCLLIAGLGLSALVPSLSSSGNDEDDEAPETTGSSPEDTSDDPRAIIEGTDLADLLVGQSDIASEIYGYDGNDEIRGREEDLLFGGDGDDTLDATGHSTAFGGSGDDYVTIFDNSRADGGSGDDIVDVRPGSYGNEITLGGGDDLVIFTAESVSEQLDPPLVELGLGEDIVFVERSGETIGSLLTLQVADFDHNEDLIVVQGVDLGSVFSGDFDVVVETEILHNEVENHTDLTFTWHSSKTEEVGTSIVRIVGTTDLQTDNVVLLSSLDQILVNAGQPSEIQVEADSDDYVIADGASSSVFTGDGNDTIEALQSDGSDELVVLSGHGDDHVFVSHEAAVVYGGHGDDSILVTSENPSDDVIISGGEGDDALEIWMGQEAYGGRGNDDFQIRVPQNFMNFEPAIIAGVGGGTISLISAEAITLPVSATTTYAENGSEVLYSSIWLGESEVVTVIGEALDTDFLDSGKFEVKITA